MLIHFHKFQAKRQFLLGYPFLDKKRLKPTQNSKISQDCPFRRPGACYAGLGVGLGREAASLMVGQYFKRRREAVEVLLVAASGLGVSVMLSFLNTALR